MRHFSWNKIYSSTQFLRLLDDFPLDNVASNVLSEDPLAMCWPPTELGLTEPISIPVIRDQLKWEVFLLS